MPDSKQILATPMRQPNDADAQTIGDYLIGLLRDVWLKEADFDGKRPYGNSGWSAELEIALIDAGYVDGVIDEDGYLESVDSESAKHLIASVINDLRTFWKDPS